MGKRKISAFEKECTTINNRLHKFPGKLKALKMAKRIYQAGPIYRKWYGKTIHYCSECGNQINWIGQKECPYCHAKWTAEPQEEIRKEAEYFMVLEAKGDIQLERIYRVDRYLKLHHKVQYNVWEVERMMYSPFGYRKVFAASVMTMCGYYDAFCYGSKLTIKRDNASWSTIHRYNLPVFDYHIESLTKQWQYKDIPSLMSNFDNDTTALRLIAYPYGETILKSGQVNLFSYLVKQKELMPKGLERVVNICNRNHYIIQDVSLWLDTIKLLQHFKMDIHNPKYVCPKDLLATHNMLNKRRQKELQREAAIWEKERLQRQMEEDKKLAKMVSTWHEHMGKILTLSLTANNLTIRPLQNVEEFREEGDAMHHCVYAMKYWNYDNHPNSLILSAKDSEGNRLATIEYNKQTEEIVQCRAACNEVPKRDAEIRALINNNKAAFDKLLKAA